VLLWVCYVALQRVLQLIYLLFRSTEFKSSRLSFCATSWRFGATSVRPHFGRPTDSSSPRRPDFCRASGERRFSSRRRPCSIGTADWSRSVGRTDVEPVDRRFAVTCAS
jgi:hypothetical protein